jgi:hypothetical protein
VARQPASQAELDQLGFAAFDIIEVDGEPAGDVFSKTWKQLNHLFKDGKRATVVESVWLTDSTAIEAQFRKWIDQGAEGAVVRSDAVGRFKLKPRHTLDAVVIGFTEAREDRVGMIHDLLLGLIRQDGCLQVLGHVGGGFSNDERRALLSDLKDAIVESDYVEVNDQVAYHMVKPELVIELSVLDLIAETTRGQAINKMVLGWDSAKRRYTILRRMPLVAMISPQFVRRRDDKGFVAADVPLKQVTDLVNVPFIDRDARQVDLPKSEVLRREVCQKQLKGQTAVRKLLMWKTNKDGPGDEFPAYVIHYTDFSPNRKTPLERDIRVSSSREQIDSLWSELAAEAFTKGWIPVSSSTAASPPPAQVHLSPATANPNAQSSAATVPPQSDGSPVASDPAATDESRPTPPPPSKAKKAPKPEAEDNSSAGEPQEKPTKGRKKKS